MTDIAAMAEFIEARQKGREAAANRAASIASPDWHHGLAVTVNGATTLIFGDSEEGWVLADTFARPDEYIAPFITANDPASVLRDVSQTRSLVAEILSWPHSQAVEPGDDTAPPGSGCTNENTGKPCDCGRDTRVHRMLEIIAGRWKLPADLPQNHQRRGRQ